MSFRYIGSKARVVNEIVAFLGPAPKNGGSFVDAFCGTGAVSEGAARAGWSIRLNDHLLSAVTMAHARLVSHHDAPFRSLGGYSKALERLNATKPVRGFLYREYSPASEKRTGVARMYFTEANAARIDGIRKRIAAWRADEAISVAEERLLIADLLLATNRVANIAGTYGCFLSHWSGQSQDSLALRPRELFPRRVAVQTSIADVTDVKVAPEDLVYLDPPYTKRQYAAYYHVLETITAGDEPTVGGITGLRPWQEKASDFCYRTRALRALVQLVEKQVARRVLLSYSSEGHVALQPLADGLSTLGGLSVVLLKEVGRYRPNRAASDAGSAVTEYLLVVDRVPQGMRKAASA
jgi:adenine-specific DNA-methyltransferase